MKPIKKQYTHEYEIPIFKNGIDRAIQVSIKFEQKDTKWEFVECRFNTLSTNYTLEEWQILSDINQEIKKLSEELNK